MLRRPASRGSAPRRRCRAPHGRPATPDGRDAGLPVVVLTRAAGAPLLRRASDTRRARRRARDAAPCRRQRGRRAPRRGGRPPARARWWSAPTTITWAWAAAARSTPDSDELHNGADDNASGTAALLEVGAPAGRPARASCGATSTSSPSPARRWACSARPPSPAQPPAGLRMEDLVAMLNMDMVGRLRENRSCRSWAATRRRSGPSWCDRPASGPALACTIGGDGYGPSDQMPVLRRRRAGAALLHRHPPRLPQAHRRRRRDQRRGRRAGRRRWSPTWPLAPGRPRPSASPTRARRRPRRRATCAPAAPRWARSRTTPGRRPARRAARRRAAGQRRPRRPASGAATCWSSSPARPIRDIHDLMYVLRSAKAGRDRHGRGRRATASGWSSR